MALVKGLVSVSLGKRFWGFGSSASGFQELGSQEQSFLVNMHEWLMTFIAIAGSRLYDLATVLISTMRTDPCNIPLPSLLIMSSPFSGWC